MYTKDPDRYTRGVGAIASRDAVRRPRRMRRRVRSLGASPAAGGSCYVMQDGTYYLRTEGSTRTNKVSPEEAMTYPACTVQPTPLTPTTGTSYKGKSSQSSFGPPAPGMVSSTPAPYAPGTNVTPVGPLTPPSSTPPSFPPPPPPSSSGAEAVRPLRPRPASPQPMPPTPTSPLPPAPTSVKPPSVSITWVPPSSSSPGSGKPAPTPATTYPTLPESETDELILVTPAPAAPVATSKKTRNLVLLGAGIGLLYLFTRD